MAWFPDPHGKIKPVSDVEFREGLAELDGSASREVRLQDFARLKANYPNRITLGSEWLGPDEYLAERHAFERWQNDVGVRLDPDSYMIFQIPGTTSYIVGFKNATDLESLNKVLIAGK